MMRAAHELRGAGTQQRPDLVVAEAGYCHQAQIESLERDSIRVLIPPRAEKRRRRRAEKTVSTRSCISKGCRGPALREAPHDDRALSGDTKFNRRPVSTPGRSAARPQSRLTNAAHTLLKLWRHTSSRQAG